MSSFEEYSQAVAQSTEDIGKIPTAALIETLGTISTVRIRELLGELTTEIGHLTTHTHTARDTAQSVQQKTKEGVEQLLQATAGTASDHALGAQTHGLATQEKAAAPIGSLDEICDTDRGTLTSMIVAATAMQEACDDIDIMPHELTRSVEKSQESSAAARAAAQRYIQDIQGGGDR
jgi:hypothetical protein